MSGTPLPGIPTFPINKKTYKVVSDGLEFFEQADPTPQVKGHPHPVPPIQPHYKAITVKGYTYTIPDSLAIGSTFISDGQSWRTFTHGDQTGTALFARVHFPTPPNKGGAVMTHIPTWVKLEGIQEVAAGTNPTLMGYTNDMGDFIPDLLAKQTYVQMFTSVAGILGLGAGAYLAHAKFPKNTLALLGGAVLGGIVVTAVGNRLAVAVVKPGAAAVAASASVLRGEVVSPPKDFPQNAKSNIVTAATSKAMI